MTPRWSLPEPKLFDHRLLCTAFVFADPAHRDALFDALAKTLTHCAHPSPADLFFATATHLRERTPAWALCAYWSIHLAAHEDTRT